MSSIEKFKKVYLIIDQAFAWIKETTIGKFIIEKILFRAKGFYTVLLFILSYFIWEIRAYNYGKGWQDYVNNKIENSEGFSEFLWEISAIFVPEGSLLLIIILFLALFLIFWLRSKELNYINTVKNLNITLPSATPINKSLTSLKYQSEIVNFIGRESELSQLETFIESDGWVKWWIIGGTGGSGKSRLALQISKIYTAKGWHCGFINYNTILNFNEWEPDKNHLIICDYVLNKEDSIIDLISNAIKLKLSGKLYFKIRILLIERDANTITDILNNVDTFGPMCESYLYPHNSLTLTDLKDKELKIMLQELAIYFGLPTEKLSYLYDFVSQYKSRGFLMGGIFCLYYNQTIIDENIGPEELIQKLIEREKKHWALANNQEKYLILATLIGGIDANKQVLSDEVQVYLNNYNAKMYKKIVGESSSSYIAPLSHDLINELYVLDELKPQNSFNNEKYLEFIELALGVDEGKELISFFTRSSQDYPKHKTLENLKNPYKESGNGFIKWALTISNIVDVINLTKEEKLDIYQKVAFGLTSFVPESHLIDKALFLRLLNDLSGNKKARMYLGYIKINEPILIHAEKSKEQAKGFLDTLLPLQYCEDIISLFIDLDNKYQNIILGSHIVEIYHHLLMHLSVDRSIDYQKIIDIYDEISKFIEDKGQDNYMITIISYHRLCTNLIASIWQFGHLRNNAEYRLEFALNIKDKALKSSHIKYNNIDAIVQTSYLSQLYPPLSIYYANNKDRSYSKLIELIKEYKQHFRNHNKIEDVNFVGCCVQLAHGFQSQEDYDYFLTLYDECKVLAEKHKTQEIIISFSLIVHQMLKNNSVVSYTEYIKQPHDDMFMKEAINLAINYPTIEYGILTDIFREISSRYLKYIESKDYEKALSYIDIAVEIILNTEDIEYIESQKIWASGFVIVGLMDYINNDYPLDNTIKILNFIEQAKYLTIEQAVHQTTSDIFSMGTRAKNSGNLDINKRCIECLSLVQPYLSERQATTINQFIEHL